MATEDLDLGYMQTQKGHTCGLKWLWSGKVGGKSVIELGLVWRLGYAMEPDWPTEEGYVVDIDGDPGVHCKFELRYRGGNIDFGAPTVFPAVNAILHVVAATPGLVTAETPTMLVKTSTPGEVMPISAGPTTNVLHARAAIRCSTSRSPTLDDRVSGRVWLTPEVVAAEEGEEVGVGARPHLFFLGLLRLAVHAAPEQRESSEVVPLASSPPSCTVGLFDSTDSPADAEPAVDPLSRLGFLRHVEPTTQLLAVLNRSVGKPTLLEFLGHNKRVRFDVLYDAVSAAGQ